MSTVSREVQGLEVRRLAVELYRTCLNRRLTVEDALHGSARAAALEPRDRAFLLTLLLTVFRHKGEIEAVATKLLAKPLPRKSGPAADILALGVAQLIYLGMPAHAVIDLAVRIAKEDRNAQHFAGLINAVLRRVSSAGDSLLEDVDAARLNTPSWLWERWSTAYGPNEAGRIARSHGERPGLDLSFKDKASRWVNDLSGKALPNGQLRLSSDHAPVPDLPGFAEGAWWVQDAAATIPVRLFGGLDGMTALDLCAAPGGKTLQMAALGAKVTAVDISEQRMRRLRDNLARTGLAAEVRVADVLSSEVVGAWDAVLLDAPCSATGTIRRHPELPYLKGPNQVREVSGLQRLMLRKAASLVRPGGLLVYCTCSLEPEEGEMQVRKFLANHEAFEIIPAALADLPDGACRPEGWVRTLPFMAAGDQAGMDGFFAAAMRRRA